MRRSRFSPLPTLLSLSLFAAAAFAAPAPRGVAADGGAWKRVERDAPLPSCLAPGRHAPLFVRESRLVAGGTIDPCGRRAAGPGQGLPPSAATKLLASPLSIDRMTTAFSGSHAAGGAIGLVGHADAYEMSDGSSWTSGAGSFFLYSAQLDHVEVAGSTIRYFLVPPPAGSLYEQTDFDAGDHSAQGRLAPSGPLVLEAQAGSATAVLAGSALIASNDPTSFGDRFHYYSSVPGAVVPFAMTFTMSGGTWGPDSFAQPFSYSIAGFVDFAHPVSSPGLAALRIEGSPQIPDESTVRYRATVAYANGVEREVGTRSAWTVAPSGLATVNGGLLSVGTVTPPEASLTLQATFGQGAESLTATKVVRALAEVTAEKPGTWPMFQANARHTGHVEVSLNALTFRLRWQRDLETGSALHPVAAGDGKVFVTRRLYEEEEPNVEALRASDGATLWSRPLGSDIQVNPPSYAYGTVYVQTDAGASSGWLRALDGETGGSVFQETFSKQSASYYAPTVFDGKVYANGGFAGGMYAFDAYGAGPLWFTTLPQVDQWTPAADAANAYAYLGGNAPGFYARNRATGAASYFVSDPSFSGGSNMNLAPVLGDHDDALAINNGRLLSYDTAAHNLRWQVAAAYAGQPSVAHGRIYALDGGRLRVLDEVTHVEAWSWLPPDGSLTGPVIVTDQYVFASTSSSVHAVDLTTHQSVWTYPVAGSLALADGTLYVASADGKLSAFGSPSATSLYTLTPCRVVDTRLSTGVPVGGPALAANVPRNLPIAGSCGVPTTAVAVVLNVTVTQATGAGFVQLDGTGRPGAFSTLNYPVGATRANLSFSSLSPSGALTALASQANGTTVHLLVDVTGYFQ